MLSRVADSMYWMSRYVERAENVARFIDVNLHLSLDLPGGEKQQWEPLVVTTGDLESFTKLHGEATRKTVIDFLVFDPQNPNSIVSCLTSARENARSIREVITTEFWEQINTFYHMVRDASSARKAEHQPYEYFRDIKLASHLACGIMDYTMTHNEAWHFARLGRMIERAEKTSRILDVKYYILLPDVNYVGSPFDDIQWAALLRSASAFEMYRQRHGLIAPDHIVEFLLLDREFPRSVHHCVSISQDSLHKISGTPTGMFRNPAEQRLGQLRAELDYTQMADVIAQGLHEFVDRLQLRLNGLGDAIFETFFSLPPPAVNGYSNSQ